MKSTLLSLACVGLVAAQAGIPTCARGCVSDITSGGSIGGCEALNIACVCKNGSLLDSIACCLERSCDEAGKEAAVKFAAEICEGAGVTDIPTAVVCKTDEPSNTQTSGSGTVTPPAGAAGDTPGATPSGGDQTTTTTGGSGSETSGSGDGGEDAAAGVSAPLGLMGAVFFGWLAL